MHPFYVMLPDSVRDVNVFITRYILKIVIQSLNETYLKLVSHWDATISRLVGDKGLRYKRDFLPFFSHCGHTGHTDHDIYSIILTTLARQS